ncbi:DUF262 domain-containing protein [Vibrio parahaemolyticus]|uniref:DUF262 domain-containing protein n=1 Tax=Vibrio parahaemolyticus TaxID=670 RepID=UPI001EF7C0DD|nr:DUF262 domain-containing protein [Vibrio parahaemolyticus]EGR1155666.1 DUF262 domain-containing protein [Vibrio parahaemolyticus]MCG7824008.1 DUF262 domain-containing protein [Vibrio parahaemolyticus]
MAVVVASCTLEKLFSGVPILASDGKVQKYVNGMLAIPEYQRPYRWNEEQITRLLNDFKLHQQELEHCPFYLGSVILHQHGDKLNIIDGQQRLTTLALISHLAKKHSDLKLVYESPESQQQIKHNLGWLYAQEASLADIDFAQINITLVVTDSEDEAYRFFETQNTGGVRLAGPDIIKAHHLRAVDEKDKSAVNAFATRWEALGDLNPVVDILLRGRYWQYLNFRDYPLHNQTQQMRNSIVTELAEHTGKGDDIAFGRIARTYMPNGGESLAQPQVGYELRQPLNSGANTIHYLQYFEQLRQTYLLNNTAQGELAGFYEFYQKLVCKLDGCGYLKQLYDACLLLYISQHGQQSLEVAAKKLFRVVYSRRVENQKAVKEKSVPAFVKETPVLDWIAMSYTPEQCFAQLDGFKLSVDKSGFDKNSVKKRFVEKVSQYFGLDIDKQDYANQFGPAFSQHTSALGAKHG